MSLAASIPPRIEQAAELRLADHLGAAADVELVVDVLGVRMNRVPADAHSVRIPRARPRCVFIRGGLRRRSVVVGRRPGQTARAV